MRVYLQQKSKDISGWTNFTDVCALPSLITYSLRCICGAVVAPQRKKTVVCLNVENARSRIYVNIVLQLKKMFFQNIKYTIYTLNLHNFKLNKLYLLRTVKPALCRIVWDQ